MSLFKAFKKLADKSTWQKCVIGSMVITSYEFVSGCIFNLWLKLKVWDYSKQKFNIKGQVCLLYSILWALLCLPVNKICDKIE